MQQGKWFPRLTFSRKKNWDVVIGDAGASGATAGFDDAPRTKGGRLLTLSVQSAAMGVWPNGVRTHTLGTQTFKPSYVHGHDIKRGAAIELAVSGM